MVVVTRARVIVLATAVVLTGCSALIGVNDIFLDDSSGSGEAGAGDGSFADDRTEPEGGFTDGGNCNADAMADPANCGRCGHDCLGGNCTTGICQPMTVLNAAASPRDFALDDQFAYVTNYGDSTIKKVPKDGGTPTNIVANWDSVSGVAVADNKLFWTGTGAIADGGQANDGLWSCSLPACADKKLLQPISFGRRLVVKDNIVYSASDDGVGRVYTDGGAPAILNDDRNPYAVTVDSTHVYYLSAYDPSRALLDGGAPEDLGTTANNFAGLLAIDDAGVYWTSWDDNNDAGSTVTGATKAGTGSITYSSKSVRPYGIASDGTNIYWANQGRYDDNSTPSGDGQILSCPVAGCAGDPIVVVDKLLAPSVVQLEGDAVWFIEYGGVPGAKGRLLKVAKP